MISGSVRFLVNLESLNGVESIGNLTKHRTAPIVVKASGGEYLIRYVPVISGEALAHAYQATLVDISKSMKLPVSSFSSQYEFIKFSTDEVLKQENITPPKDYDDARRFEVEVMLKDMVADVGGFMYAGRIPIRRTSRIKFGYMIPALQGEEIPAQLEAQFHVRFSNRAEKDRQAIFNVEVSSALYVLSFELDEDLIAVPSTVGEKHKDEAKLESEKQKRIEAGIKALYSILSGNFGGKRSRFLPSMKLMSLVVTRTDFPFIPEPAHENNYVEVTVGRMAKAKNIFNGKTAEAYVINNEGLSVPSNAKVVSTVEDLIDELVKKVKG